MLNFIGTKRNVKHLSHNCEMSFWVHKKRVGKQSFISSLRLCRCGTCAARGIHGHAFPVSRRSELTPADDAVQIEPYVVAGERFAHQHVKIKT